MFRLLGEVKRTCAGKIWVSFPIMHPKLNEYVEVLGEIRSAMSQIAKLGEINLIGIKDMFVDEDFRIGVGKVGLVSGIKGRGCDRYISLMVKELRKSGEIEARSITTGLVLKVQDLRIMYTNIRRLKRPGVLENIGDLIKGQGISVFDRDHAKHSFKKTGY